MANTFKVFTIADVAVDSGTYSTIYTCAGSTTGIVLGLNITLEVMGGQKHVIETTDVLTIGAEAGSALDATLSMMEIT